MPFPLSVTKICLIFLPPSLPFLSSLTSRQTISPNLWRLSTESLCLHCSHCRFDAITSLRVTLRMSSLINFCTTNNSCFYLWCLFFLYSHLFYVKLLFGDHMSKNPPAEATSLSINVLIQTRCCFIRGIFMQKRVLKLCNLKPHPKFWQA